MVIAAAVVAASAGVCSAQPTETAAQAGEKVGIEGLFVRVAENSEGFVVLSYKIANDSVNKEWMLLDVGITVQQGAQPQKITRDDVKLVTPDHQVIDLPTQEEYNKVRGSLAALEERANMMGDSINYFPPGANNPCRIGFFATTTGRQTALAYDEVELDSTRACVGTLFFHVPGGIQLGNYNLDVKFADSVVKVPVQIMTKQEAKEFEKKWQEAAKEKK
ncbi:MAG: hypothetical protein WBQ27_03085 [Thermoanaerobaculia bacterium]